MTCLFLRNVPAGTQFIPGEAAKLYEAVALAAGVTPDGVEVHISFERIVVLRRDGTINQKVGVHTSMEWHEGRTAEQRAGVAKALHEFLLAHGLEWDDDLTFCDRPRGTGFALDGVMVK